MKSLSFAREPVMWIHLLAAILSAAAAFGFDLTADQTAALMALAQAVAAIISRSQVTPA